MIRFYLSPMVTKEIPPMTYSKTEDYLDYSAGDRHVIVCGNPWKMWCLDWVDAVETTHVAIQADPQIRLIPFWDGSGDYLPLSAEVRDVVEPYRSNIAIYLEDHRIPPGWITGSITLGGVLRYIIQILLTVQRMKEDYPEYDLGTQIKDVPGAQRSRIMQWMNDNGIETSDINANWTVQQVLGRIIRDYGWQGVYQFGTSLL